MPRAKKPAGSVVEAERMLAEWAAVAASRDALVRAACDVGVSKHRIHVLTGIARTTLDRILSLGSTAIRQEDSDAPH